MNILTGSVNKKLMSFVNKHCFRMLKKINKR